MKKWKKCNMQKIRQDSDTLKPCEVNPFRKQTVSGKDILFLGEKIYSIDGMKMHPIRRPSNL